MARRWLMPTLDAKIKHVFGLLRFSIKRKQLQY